MTVNFFYNHTALTAGSKSDKIKPAPKQTQGGRNP